MADFQYDPIDGHLNTEVFIDYPPADQVRPYIQRLFDQIRDAFNGHKNETETTTTQPHGLSKNKLDATVAPTVNDDSGDGYSVNSEWVDIINDKAYKCLDATVGAAVWKETTVPEGEPLLGNLKFIANYTVTNAAYADIPFPANTKYVKVVFNWLTPITNAVNMQAQISSDGGATFKSDAYYNYAGIVIDSSADTLSALRANSATSVILTPTAISNSSAARQIVELEFFNTNQGIRPQFEYNVIATKSTGTLDTITVKGTARYAVALQVNAVRLFMSSGNVSSANVDVFAILAS